MRLRRARHPRRRCGSASIPISIRGFTARRRFRLRRISSSSSRTAASSSAAIRTPYNDAAMSHKDFIEIHDYSADEVREIFEIARDMKANREKYRDALKGKTLAMIFEKSSTRTRV